MHIKLYDTWKKAKGVFKKPRLIFKYGNWYKSSGLPVWRRGRTYWFGKYGEYEQITVKKWRKPIKTKNLNIEGAWIDGWDYDWKAGYKEQHPIISMLFKPRYELPKWFTFYIFNNDLWWKTKWNDYRFEFAPQFTIVFLYWHISFFLAPPEGCRVDDYWESVLWYIEKRNLEKTFNEMRAWKNLQTGEINYRLTPEMVEPEYQELIQYFIEQRKEKDNTL